MKVVGCDAGGDGAFYALDWTGTRWNPAESLVMPMVDVGKRVREVDVPAVADWLSALTPSPSLLVIEEVGYLPSGEGKSGFSGGAFTAAILTARYERLIGMLQTLRTIPYRPVKPSTWPGTLGIRVSPVKGEPRKDKKKRIKAATLAFVRQSYPSAGLVPPRCRVPHDGLADALALAHLATMILAENAPAAPA